MNYFITAIGTDSGKTVVSAILCEALGADYWKPVQCGEPRDTNTVRELTSNSDINYLEETYFLKKPASPHDAAKEEGIVVQIDKLKHDYELLQSPTIIEGAGGLMVPLNDDDFILDIPSKLEIQVILVANLYLGSINHTLLSINELQRQNIEVAGIIFNGASNPESERIILKHSGYKKLLHLQQETEVNQEMVKKYAQVLIKNWNE